jgi:hypothetical protein
MRAPIICQPLAVGLQWRGEGHEPCWTVTSGFALHLLPSLTSPWTKREIHTTLNLQHEDPRSLADSQRDAAFSNPCCHS